MVFLVFLLRFSFLCLFVAPEAGSDVFSEIKTFWEALRATCEEIILKNPEGIRGD